MLEIGEIKKFPHLYWNKNTAKIAVRFLIEKKLKWNRKDICRYLTIRTFSENKLGNLLRSFFNNNLYNAINAAYPGEYKPWELRSVCKGYWTKETSIEAIKWLIEEKLKWSKDDVCNNLDITTFSNNNLTGPLSFFSNSVYKALCATYPKRYKAWELKSVPQNYWNKKTAKAAVRWLIEKKLKWSHNEVCEKLNMYTFWNHNLRYCLETIYSGKVYNALNAAFPGEYEPWELKKIRHK